MQLLKRQKRGDLTVTDGSLLQSSGINKVEQTKELSPLCLTAEEGTNIKQFSGYDINQEGVLGMTLHATHTRTQTLVQCWWPTERHWRSAGSVPTAHACTCMPILSAI